MILPAVDTALFGAVESFVICGAALWLLLRSGVADCVPDTPNARSLHARPIPRVGGLGIMLGVGITAVTLGSGPRFYPLLPLIVISLIDDLRSLSIVPRLAVQLIAVAWALWSVVDGMPVGFVVALALVVVWGTNLYNFMDGSDGLAGGMTLFGFSFFALAAVQGDDASLAAYCLAFVASALAFLVFNFHPARVFMGDTGSTAIGFAAAAIGIEGAVRGLWTAWFPLLVFAPFVFDASVTLLKRVMRGERFWQAHREHYYQRMIRMGRGHRRTALIYFGLMLAAGIAAEFARRMGGVWPIAMFGAALVLAFGLMRAVDRAWSEAAP